MIVSGLGEWSLQWSSLPVGELRFFGGAGGGGGGGEFCLGGGWSLSAMKVIPFALPGSGNYNGR
jgi:hypothetical protein